MPVRRKWKSLMKEYYSLHYHYVSTPSGLLIKSKSTMIHIYLSRQLALDIFKTTHNPGLAFIKEYFIQKSSKRYLRMRNTLYIPKVKNTVREVKLLSFLGTEIWSSLPDDMKPSNNARQFKMLIDKWLCENKCA